MPEEPTSRTTINLMTELWRTATNNVSNILFRSSVVS